MVNPASTCLSSPLSVKFIVHSICCMYLFPYISTTTTHNVTIHVSIEREREREVRPWLNMMDETVEQCIRTWSKHGYVKDYAMAIWT
ncbi:hypothetical protein ACF0H5_005001 [Mactra antiquata]